MKFGKIIFLTFLLFSFAITVNAHAAMHAEPQANDQLFANPEPVVSPDISMLPIPNIVKSVFEEQPTPIDPGPIDALIDPGNDPNAPIDSKIWILFSVIGILGIIQYRKSKSVSSI